MRICEETRTQTRCTDSCRDCAREFYKELQSKCGQAELVTEAFVIKCVGLSAFQMLKSYGFIEHCRVDECGVHWYAI